LKTCSIGLKTIGLVARYNFKNVAYTYAYAANMKRSVGLKQVHSENKRTSAGGWLAAR